MKKILLYIFFHAINLASAQNLVKNPSFEDYVSCPTWNGDLDLALFWHNAQGTTTPDLFNVCALPQSLVSVPTTGWGYQMPRTGNGYAGIVTFSVEENGLTGCDYTATRTWMEYIQGELTTPLIAGQIYCVSFWVSLAEECRYGATNMGVHFSDTIINIINFTALPLPVVPQLVNTTMPLDDTYQWQKLEWNYIAQGGERFLCIGNFDAAGATNAFPNSCDEWVLGAYYYIDDVSVEKGACPHLGPYFEGIPNAFTPNNDGFNDRFVPLGIIEQNVLEFKIFNRWGQAVYDNPNINNSGGWDGTFQGVQQPSESYIYLLRYHIQGQEEIVLRGEVTLIR